MISDKIGKIFGRLTVVNEAPRNKHNQRMWNCVCVCGNATVVAGGTLVTGHTTSCGCLHKEKITKHGGWKKSSYNTWRAMIRRCYNPKDKDYVKYGGKGIKVCLQWRDYLAFEADMGEPIEDQTLDRIDPYGDYTPENCRWASLTTQARNHRIHKTNKFGVTGIKKSNQKYIAFIHVNRVTKASCVADTIEQAAELRKELEAKYWGKE